MDHATEDETKKAPFADFVNDVNEHLASGGKVLIRTHTAATLYSQKHAGWFTQSKDGSIFVKHGKRSVCLGSTRILLVAAKLLR